MSKEQKVIADVLGATLVASQIIKMRYEGLILLNCQMSNLNGDPDDGNNPRIDPVDNRGIMRDAAPKRRIRDYIEAVFKLPLLIRRGSDLNTRIAEAHVSANGKLPDIDKSAKTPSYKTTLKESSQEGREICKKYIDARYHGFVGETGANAGQVTGPIQFSHTLSVCPITLVPMALTRCADALSPSKWPEALRKPLEEVTVKDFQAAEQAVPANSLRSMGRTCVAEHALFPIKFFLSAALAQQTGLTEADFEMFLEAALNMYEGPNRTGSKSDMSVQALVLFRHIGTATNDEDRAREASKGCAPAHTLLNLVKIKLREGLDHPQQFADYDISIDTVNIPLGVEMGFCRYVDAKVETYWLRKGGELPTWLPENMTASTPVLVA